MIEVATALNNFASNEAAQPSEQVFVLSSSQFQDPQEAIDSLLVRIDALESENLALKSKLETKVLELEMWIQALSKKIHRLEGQDFQPLQKDRSEILIALIQRDGGKMLMKDAKKIMHLSDSRISELVSRMGSLIEVRVSNLDKRQKILVLR